MNINQIKRKAFEHRDSLKKLGVKKIGFFGSVVRDEATEDSDIDIMVIFEPGEKTFDNFMDLHDELESLYDKKVDLVTPESISKYILPYVEDEVVYEEL